MSVRPVGDAYDTAMAMAMVMVMVMVMVMAMAMVESVFAGLECELIVS